MVQKVVLGTRVVVGDAKDRENWKMAPPEPGPPKGSRDVVMVQGNASQGKDRESQEGTPQVIPIHTPAPKKGSLNVAELQVDPSNAPSPSMTGPAVFGGASNVRIDGMPNFNAAGNNVYQNIINFNYEKEKENLNKKLREKINPIINPVKKQIYCAEGTRLQLLDDITQWVLKPDNHHVAWIYGLAGSGKSAVAVSLAERLREMDGQVTLALTFHCVKGQETSNTFQLVPTICYYLAQCVPQYAKALVDVFEKDASLHAGSIPIKEQLSRFLKPLYKIDRAQNAASTIIIIDGLDEWGTPEDQSIFLENLYSHLQKIGRIYIVITSRREQAIARAMSNSSVVQSFDLTGSYPAEEDIAKFFEMCLGANTAHGISGHDIDALTKRAGNLFIWASTAVNYLKIQYNLQAGVETLLKTKDKTARDNIENPHSDLYDLYTAVLHNLPRLKSTFGIPLFRLVIGLIVSAYEPFTVKALTKMLEQQSQVAIDYSMVDGMINDLPAVLSTSNGQILYHLSLAEFLSSEQCPTQYRISHEGSHEVLGSICLKVMMNELKFNICNLETSSIRNSEVLNLEERIDQQISPQLQYSVKWWGYHGEEGNCSKEMRTGVQNFTSGSHLIYWMECMSLLKKVTEIKVNARKVAPWSRKHKLSQVELIMKEVERFTDVFSIPLTESTPHLYTSGCAMTPMTSILREGKSKWNHSGVKVEISGGMEIQWEKTLHLIHVGSEVQSVAVSPNGQQVVSGSEDKTVRIWNVQTGQQIGDPLHGHTDWVTSVAFSPNGKQVVSGSHDKTVRIWNVQTGQQIGGPLHGHTNFVTSVAFSPDGQQVVSGSTDQTVRIWNVQTGQQIGDPLHGHTSQVTSVAFSPDGQQVVSGSEDKTVRIWNVQTGQQIGDPLHGHTSHVTSLAFSPDGQQVVCGSNDQTVRIWNVQTGQQIGDPLHGHTSFVTSVAFSPDGQQVVSGSNDQTVRIWNVQTGQQIGDPLRGHTDWVTSVAFSPDGQQVVSGSFDETVRIWNVQTGQQIGDPLYGYTSEVTSVAFSPDGQQVVSGSTDQTVRIWNVQTGRQIGDPLHGHTSLVTSVAFSPDGQQVVSGSWDHTVRIWNVQTGQQIGDPLHGHTNFVTSVAFSPDGQQVVSGSFDETVRIWNVQTGQQIGDPLYGYTSEVTSVAFSPDGQQVVSGSTDQTVRIWNVQTGQQIGDPLHGHTSLVTSVAFSPDGQQVVSGSWDHTVRIWNVQTGQQIGDPLYGYTSEVTSLAFSPDGQQVVSGSWDHTVRIWNVQTGQQIGDPLHGHTNFVTSVAFSPDGQQVVSGSEDKPVRIWNVQTGQQIGDPLHGHTNSVTSVAFSPDGQQVVSGSEDKTVRIWNVQTGQQCGDPLHGHTNWVTSVAFSPDGQQVVSGSRDNTAGIWTVHAGRQVGLSPNSPNSNALPAVSSSNSYHPVDNSLQLPPAISHGYITPQGWLCSDNNELLLWLLPWMVPGFRDKRQVLTIPPDALNCAISVNWDLFVYGSSWAQCWDSRLSSDDS
ncbi:hypothetical protein D9757_014774 [Collybiopsis confluens]|uniref:Nephrocystin 3-like N-terminal domain-containing protein n=1 Tax=Collybiopsis confluens TaxID=2823264 RepID=A0A8H5CQ56_9AGAR|nr:hypothetical protein D9757_014774 [Collybiopsis confluens]